MRIEVSSLAAVVLTSTLALASAATYGGDGEKAESCSGEIAKAATGGRQGKPTPEEVAVGEAYMKCVYQQPSLRDEEADACGSEFLSRKGHPMTPQAVDGRFNSIRTRAPLSCRPLL